MTEHAEVLSAGDAQARVAVLEAELATPTAEYVWVRLLDNMVADNGGPYLSSTADFDEARAAIASLIEAGFFRGDPGDLESDYWQAVGGETGEAEERFASHAEHYRVLDGVLNRVFESPADAPAPVELVEQEVVSDRAELLRLVELLGSVACAAFRSADDSFEDFDDDGAPVISCGIDQMAALGEALDACDAESEIDDKYTRDGWLTVLDKLRAALATPQPAPTAAHPDDQAVDRFAAAMKAKLASARAKGRSGWDDPDVCSVEYLAQLLREHLNKGNAGTFEDVANFCMMLHQRGADPSVLAPTTAQDVAGLEFTLMHPVDGETHTVTLTREEIQEHMTHDLYDKLGELICHCEPIGETNIVDCNCIDRIEDFEIAANQSGGAK